MIREKSIEKFIEYLQNSKCTVFFTGAGISVESGIPAFRGPGGIWNYYDPDSLSLHNYYVKPAQCWKVIKEIFYSKTYKAQPNAAHYAISKLEELGLASCVFTQNIDNLHQESGTKKVFEFHGNLKKFICQKCKREYSSSEVDFEQNYPKCPHCSGLLKPDFVFFDEGLSEDVLQAAQTYSELADLYVIIGSSGEVAPANYFPYLAKQSGATIVEINPATSAYTRGLTELYIPEKAGEFLGKVIKNIKE